MFVNDLWLNGGFLTLFGFHPLFKLTATIQIKYIMITPAIIWLVKQLCSWDKIYKTLHLVHDYPRLVYFTLKPVLRVQPVFLDRLQWMTPLNKMESCVNLSLNKMESCVNLTLNKMESCVNLTLNKMESCINPNVKNLFKLTCKNQTPV